MKRTARLAMLTLPAQEEEKLEKDFDGMVQFAGQLSRLPSVPCAAQDESAVSFREDVPRKGLEPAEVLANAPAVRDGMIAVPKSFE